MAAALIAEEVQQLAAIRKRLSGPEEDSAADATQNQTESKLVTEAEVSKGAA